LIVNPWVWDELVKFWKNSCASGEELFITPSFRPSWLCTLEHSHDVMFVFG
jgi:hypothetical protein